VGTTTTDRILVMLRRRLEEWRRSQADLAPDARLARADAMARVQTYEESIDIIQSIAEQEST
jgi:hypothetical protein